MTGLLEWFVSISIGWLQGDSGGPLELKGAHSVSKIVGVTSFGMACGFAGLPGVYTRVSHYIEWIENIVFKNVSRPF